MLPVVFVVVLAVLTFVATLPTTSLIESYFDAATLEAYPWIISYGQDISQIIAAVILMLIIGGGLRQWGFNLKSKNLYLGAAVGVGVVFGILMTLVDHLPVLLSGDKIDGYDLNTVNVLGTLTKVWVVVGISEEIVYRGLMVGFLMRKFTGQVRFFKWEIPTGGVIVAGLFALAHVESFWTGSPLYAAGQQVYAIGAGLCLAYLYAKSRSLLAPIIAHNIANGIEITAVFILKSQGF